MNCLITTVARFSTRLLLICAFVSCGSAPGGYGFCQNISAPLITKITLTGIVLTADHRCSARHETDVFCRSSNWALASGRKTYLLYGDGATFDRFARKRVKVSGLLEEKAMVESGMQMIRRRITVRSMESSELSEQAITQLVTQLKNVPWRLPEELCLPKCRNFGFTDPMVEILQAGPGAQEVLLDHIDDELVQDQIVMLLGGIGDENAIGPIIETLANENAANNPRAERLNLIGNLALTNLTVSEVIWHHGGGITVDRCPHTVKSCWSEWWLDHKDTFKVGIGGDRLYTNYPNYGIYAQFGDSDTPELMKIAITLSDYRRRSRTGEAPVSPTGEPSLKSAFRS